MVARVSPNWVKNALNIPNSSGDLSCEITQATEVIKVTNSHDFKTNTSVYAIKKRFILLLNLFKKAILITSCIFSSIYITIINTTIIVI